MIADADASADIVEFPTQFVQDWTGIERALRDVLPDFGVPDPVLESVVVTMRAFYTLLIDAGAICDIDAAKLTAFRQRLFHERLCREIAMQWQPQDNRIA